MNNVDILTQIILHLPTCDLVQAAGVNQLWRDITRAFLSPRTARFLSLTARCMVENYEFACVSKLLAFGFHPHEDILYVAAWVDDEVHLFAHDINTKNRKFETVLDRIVSPLNCRFEGHYLLSTSSSHQGCVVFDCDLQNWVTLPQSRISVFASSQDGQSTVSAVQGSHQFAIKSSSKVMEKRISGKGGAGNNISNPGGGETINVTVEVAQEFHSSAVESVWLSEECIVVAFSNRRIVQLAGCCYPAATHGNTPKKELEDEEFNEEGNAEAQRITREWCQRALPRFDVHAQLIGTKWYSFDPNSSQLLEWDLTQGNLRTQPVHFTSKTFRVLNFLIVVPNEVFLAVISFSFSDAVILLASFDGSAWKSLNFEYTPLAAIHPTRSIIATAPAASVRILHPIVEALESGVGQLLYFDNDMLSASQIAAASSSSLPPSSLQEREPVGSEMSLSSGGLMEKMRPRSSSIQKSQQRKVPSFTEVLSWSSLIVLCLALLHTLASLVVGRKDSFANIGFSLK